MGILSGLSGFGLGSFKDQKVFEEESTQHGMKEGLEASFFQPDETDFLFQKSYVCPVCDSKFKVPAVRAGRAKLIGQDEDLRPRYEGIDPIKYDAILCNNCGFAAITRSFTNMTSHQMKCIRENVTAHFKPLPPAGETFTYDDAIVRHKIALVCAMVRSAKTSERAYLCLKLAWLTRAKLEESSPKSGEYAELKSSLKEYYQNAYEGFKQAYSKENFPLMGMEEMTVTYLLAVLAANLEQYDEASKMLSRVLTSKSANQRLKDKALTLKERIKEELAEKVRQESMS